MTRREEIQQAATNYQRQFPKRYVNELHYINGAEWADSHPRTGLVDIDKVCEWIDD